MKHYHVIIAEERRAAPRQLAISMNADIRVQTGVDDHGFPVFDVTPQPPQLHTMGSRIGSLDNILYAAEWDGRAPFVRVIKGNIADIKMAYAGWPMIDEADYTPPEGPNGV